MTLILTRSMLTSNNMIESTLILTTILTEYQSVHITLTSKIHQWKSCQWLQYLSEQRIWISFLDYLRWCQQWTTWNQMNHQTCWWSKIWVYCSQLLLWRKQVIFQIRCNFMHLSWFKTITCFMFWLLAFEAKFFFKQLLFSKINIWYFEFLSCRDWSWDCSSDRRQDASNKASDLSRWYIEDWLSIQFYQLNIDLHADVDKFIQIHSSFIDHDSLKIWANLMLKII